MSAVSPDPEQEAAASPPVAVAAGPTHVGPIAAPVGEKVLSVNNIEVVYDHVILVLKGVSLAVPKGQIVALLGANGAGKSTTLKAISNLLHAERAGAPRLHPGDGGPTLFRPPHHR